MTATSCAASFAALVSMYSTTFMTIAVASTWSTRLNRKNRRATRTSAQATTNTLAMCTNARVSQMPPSPA